MGKRNLYFTLAACLCCLALSQQARANAYINGYSSVNYDPSTKIVTGTTTSELDYFAQDWYQGRVNGNLTDASSQSVASAYANDTDRDGTVTVTMQALGVDQMQYTCTGMHIALADIQDYSQGRYYYVDYHNFGYYQSENVYVLFFVPFYGPGPRTLRSNRTLLLGRTFARDADVAFTSAAFSNASAPFDDRTDTATLNIGQAAGGTSACTQGADHTFTVSINFKLPVNADSLFTQADGRSFVADSDTRQFQYARWHFENVDYTNGTGRMVVDLYRAHPAAPNDALTVTVAGTFSNGGGFTTTANVHLACP